MVGLVPTIQGLDNSNHTMVGAMVEPRQSEKGQKEVQQYLYFSTRHRTLRYNGVHISSVAMVEIAMVEIAMVEDAVVERAMVEVPVVGLQSEAKPCRSTPPLSAAKRGE